MSYTNLIRANIRNLEPYSSARDEFDAPADVFLDANESPFDNGVNRYPDPHQTALKRRIGQLKEVDSNQLILGNGSDEIIDLILRCFCIPGKDEVIITSPTYGMYRVLAAINDVTCREVLLNDDFSLNTGRIIQAVTNNTKMIILCSPNNPTGNLLAEEDIAGLLNAFPGMVLLDEAYTDFAATASWSKRLRQFPSLILCQTLSKAWGMAAIRLGIGIADPAIIQALHRIKAPYNVNKLTQAKAMEVLSDTKGFYERLEYLNRERTRMITALQQVPIISLVYPSDANFILVHCNGADRIYKILIQHGVVVRNRSSQPLCADCLRISIGLREENERLITILKNIAL